MKDGKVSVLKADVPAEEPSKPNTNEIEHNVTPILICFGIYIIADECIKDVEDKYNQSGSNNNKVAMPDVIQEMINVVRHNMNALQSFRADAVENDFDELQSEGDKCHETQWRD